MTDTTKTTTTPDDAVTVRRLELLGGRWDGRAKTWVLPRDRLGDLQTLLADIDRPAMVRRGGCIAGRCKPARAAS